MFHQPRHGIRPVQIICFVGPKGVGKTTAAKVCADIMGGTTFRFANMLKEMLTVLVQDRSYIDGDNKEVPLDVLCGKTGRYAMQTLGTEWRNMLGKELWANLLVEDITAFLQHGRAGVQPGATVVIDDMRFPHELAILEDAFGLENVYVVEVSSSEVTYPLSRMKFSLRYPLLAKLLGLFIHESECWWPFFESSFKIDNCGSLNALSDRVNSITEKVLSDVR